MTTANTATAGVSWTELRQDRAYLVQSPIGDYRVVREFASHVWDAIAEVSYEATA